ncbi:endonuclease domain-containing 1 protein-like [Brachyhypopomus gauderio]|uniref:endonuclease domain-containing 1 protein-like n=1 Tax=Brachyhypopomus gauderio TaxID=698409 RepID=UPI004041799F
MKLFSLVLLFFLGSSAVVGEVVINFSITCPQFFATPNGVATPPTVLPGTQYKQICQKRANQYEYATLYDTKNRIPVYSAYKYEGHTSCDRKDKWYIEPQLDDQNKGGDMKSDTDTTLPKPPRGDHQALNEDYESCGYDKGHLVPVYHTSSQSCADSTFTLTNAAPQDCYLNRILWRKVENDVADVLKTKCLQILPAGKAYVVTGVVPSIGVQKIINGRVNVPSHFWSAICCLDSKNNPLGSWGFLADNSNQKPISMPVYILEYMLTQLYGSHFALFGGKC